MTINKANLKFGNLTKLDSSKVDTIVIHHADMNGFVEDVHKVHLNLGWAGIGYHFYIRKDGSIWEGRPLGYLGAHVKNHNNHTVGVCLEGKLQEEQPTTAQLKSLTYTINHIKNTLNNQKLQVKPHRALMATACPGKNLTDSMIEALVGNNDPVQPITSINDILWELSYRGIMTELPKWQQKMEADKDIYWLCRKMANYTRGTIE